MVMQKEESENNSRVSERERLCEMRKMRKNVPDNVNNGKVSLEDYLLLLHSRSHLNLTIAHLNQIIHFHGYKKIHKSHKKLVSDAVNSLDLIIPCRSTLRDYISPLVSKAKIEEDVTADLSELNWEDQCCSVTSVKILGHAEESDSPPSNVAPRSEVFDRPFPGKRRSARKRRRTAAVGDLLNFSSFV